MFVKKPKGTFPGTLTDCEKVRKTSNSRSPAYIGTVERELRSKSKSLRSKLFFILLSLEYSAFVNITQRVKIHEIVDRF